MSFFTLWKIKGSQPAITPSPRVAHLEEESANNEDYIDGEDADGIEGITEEFIVCLAWAVKDAQQVENAVIIVTAQITSSAIAQWWQDKEETSL